VGERPRFHLAFAVDDLERAREFYCGLLGCAEGRSAPTWVDFDFFGHQLTAHRIAGPRGPLPTSAVDTDDVPVPHFGLILPWEEWQAVAERLRRRGVRFRIAPRVRFRGEVGEQATLFLEDPAGNALELKAFQDPGRVFAR
jgi:extradiol dioxygenase family protein